MKQEVTYDDWMKVKMVVGEVVEVGGKLSIDCGFKVFEIKWDVAVGVGDKIVVGIMGDEIIFPLVEGRDVITPVGEIENGAVVG